MKNLVCLVVLSAFSFSGYTQEIDVLHYKYELTLNDGDDTIKGVTEISFLRNKSEFAIFNLKSVGSNGKGMKLTGAGFVTDPPSFASDQTVKRGDSIYMNLSRFAGKDTITASITYKGIPADGLIISKNKYGDRTFFADNWPNRAQHWIPCVDRPNDKASFEFIVTAPSHYAVISNGVKLEEKELGNGLKRTHWKEDIPQPTKVMVIGAAKFATKIYDDSPPNIPISAWVYPQDSTKGFYDYALTPEIVKFFSNYIAPYPYKKLANVQSKTIFGGMENASAIFYAESSVTGDRSEEDLMAHEIAHQWFGDAASEKSFAHVWLSEGFATYFTNLYWEHKYGTKAMIKRLKKDREEVIAFAKTSKQPVVDSTKDLMSLLNANSYQKGGWILHMLRNEVGDSAFQKIIQAYYNQYKGSNADTRDFETMAEKVSGKELTWFFDQWLYQPGVPQLEMKIRKDNQNTFVVITQKQLTLFSFKTTLGFANQYNEAHKIIPIEISKRETEFKLPAEYTKVFLDPYQKLLFDGKDELSVTNKSR